MVYTLCMYLAVLIACKAKEPLLFGEIVFFLYWGAYSNRIRGL